MKSYQSIKIGLLVLSLGIVFSGCKEEEDTLPVVESNSNAAINRWISDVMNEVYYWLDDIGTPIDETSEPEEYYEALLFRPTDRFSAIYPNYEELINSLNGINLEAGYEFTLYREGQENVIAEVSYVKKNSPASEAEMKRGDIITSINNTQMTLDNYQELLGQIDEPHSLLFLRFNEEENGYEPQSEISLNPVQLSENPNFLDTVYTIDNQKIGYVVYHFFAPGAGGGSTAYDDEADGIFANFKSENIDHLIVDFRYNGGGFVSSAVNLASLIAPGVTNSAIFSKTKYNDFLMDNVPDLRDVQTPFRSKTENLGNTLDGNRVYVLTSARTASASELIINGLKPYMDVFIVGDTTTGKNVGSIPFEDEDNPENQYGILPIVTQSFNSADESDYSIGFNPNIRVIESSERLRQLGDVNELLLRTAIENITGTPSNARVIKLERTDVGSTLDRKIRSGRMIEDLDIK